MGSLLSAQLFFAILGSLFSSVVDPNTLNLDPDPGLYVHIFQSVEVSYIFHLLPLLYNIFTCADPDPDPQSA